MRIKSVWLILLYVFDGKIISYHWFNCCQFCYRALRMDNISQILAYANVRSGCNLILQENCSGLLLGAILKRLGGKCSWWHICVHSVSTNSLIPNALSLLYPTLPSQWFLAPARLLCVSTTATIAQIPDVSSKEGAVIGALLSKWKFHRGHHWHQTHMNNCWINLK
jgi:hypothetical protein